MQDPPARSTKHLKHLDVLRGLTALAIAWFHWQFFVFGQTKVLHWDGNWVDATRVPLSFWITYLAHYGWIGVPIFYVLSGFVIHLSQLKAAARQQPFDRSDFLWRRFWRIYPAYLVSLVVYSLVFGYRFTQPDGPFHILTHLFFLHNAWDKSLLSISTVAWSLASEVQFYLVYALFAPLWLKIGSKKVMIFAAVVSIVSLALSAVLLSDPDSHQAWIQSPFVTWVAWVVGAYLAERYFHNRPALRFPVMVPIAAVALLVFADNYKPLHFLQFQFAFLLAILIVNYYTKTDDVSKPVDKLLFYLGTISYSFYLWHMVVSMVLYWVVTKPFRAVFGQGVIEQDWLRLLLMTVLFVLVTAVNIAVATLSYRYVENVFNNLGRSWLARKNALPQGNP